MKESNENQQAVCVKCGVEKEVTEFRLAKKKEASYYDTTVSCKACHAAYMREHRYNNKANQMIIDARCRAKKHGIIFDLDYGDVSIPDLCPLLGIPIIKGKGSHDANSPSLDRIDPALGYTKDNVWVVSHRANKIKNDATVDELYTIANNLRNKQNESDLHRHRDKPST